MISKVSHFNIDKTKWNKAILHSQTPEIYALSWYLDCVSPNWEAVVYNDYEAVMPLPIKKIFTFSYIVQPPFCQKLGIFSATNLNENIHKQFYNELCKFLSVRYSSNSRIKVKKTPTERVNLILNLNNSYGNIYKNFSENCKRNIKKTIKQELTSRQIEIDVFLRFYSENIFYSIPESYVLVTKNILFAAKENNAIEFYGTFANNELNSVVAFLKGPKQYYYLMAGSNKIGKENRAMFSLINTFIETHAGKDSYLDFEGSEIESVARFYKGFGAVNSPYFYYENHRLPFLKSFMG